MAPSSSQATRVRGCGPPSIQSTTPTIARTSDSTMLYFTALGLLVGPDRRGASRVPPSSPAAAGLHVERRQPRPYVGEPLLTVPCLPFEPFPLGFEFRQRGRVVKLLAIGRHLLRQLGQLSLEGLALVGRGGHQAAVIGARSKPLAGRPGGTSADAP